MSITIHKIYNCDSTLEKCGIYVAKVAGWKELSLVIISNIYNDTNNIISCFYLGIPIDFESQVVNHHLTRYIKLPDFDGNYNHFQINIKDMYPISQIKEYVPYVVNDNFFKVKDEVLNEWCGAANSGIYHRNIAPNTIKLGNVYIATIVNTKKPMLIVVIKLAHNHETKASSGYFLCVKKVKANNFNKKILSYDLPLENETDYVLRINCQVLYPLDIIKSFQPYYVGMKPLLFTEEILLTLLEICTR